MTHKPPQGIDARHNEFMHGFAVAVGTLARNGYPSHALDIMDCNGISLADLEKAKCPSFDLKPIRREWKLMERKR